MPKQGQFDFNYAVEPVHSMKCIMGNQCNMEGKSKVCMEVKSDLNFYNQPVTFKCARARVFHLPHHL